MIQYLCRVNCTSSNSYTTRCQRGQECCKPLEKNTWQLTYLFARQLKNMKETQKNYLVLVFYCTQILTIWWNISNRIQQVLSGDSHIVKPENKSPKSSLHPSCANKTVIDKKRKVWLIPDSTIINTIQTNFMATISYTDVWAYVSIYIPDLGYKSVDPFIHPIYVELRKDYSVCCMLNTSKIVST